MGIIFRRVWRAVGVWGVLTLLTSLIIFYEWAFHSPRTDPAAALIAAVLFIAGLAQFAYKMGGYQRSQATKAYAEVVPALLASTEEFSLVLRPFGADGETFLRQYETTIRGKKRLTSRAQFAENRTMEQVFAEAAHKTVQQKLYALVDQSRELAPPGAVYVRVPNVNWQDAVLALMRRAYAVILWLPAGQDLRESFNWEIEQIVLAGLQDRTIIVMPPPNEKATYQRAVKQAAVLLAAMETATGKTALADPLRVQHYEGMLGDRTIAMKFAAAKDGNDPQLIRRLIADRRPLTWQRMIRNVLLFWVMAWYGFAYFRDRRRNGRVNVWTYEWGVTSLLTIIRKELAGQPFLARYPSYRPDLSAETVTARPSAEPLGS
jgi:hypothetical protein